jgi:hypothetical protein
MAARQSQAFRALDKSLRALKGAEREAVLLRSRCDFEFEAIGEIMGLSEADAEQLFLRGMQRIDAECSGVVEQPERTLSELPSHPPPEHSSQATMNLSVMMHDIKARPVRLWSPFRLITLILIVAAAVIYYFFPEQVHQVIDDTIGRTIGGASSEQPQSLQDEQKP